MRERSACSGFRLGGALAGNSIIINGDNNVQHAIANEPGSIAESRVSANGPPVGRLQLFRAIGVDFP
jgi:hypothetical protein